MHSGIKIPDMRMYDYLTSTDIKEEEEALHIG